MSLDLIIQNNKNQQIFFEENNSAYSSDFQKTDIDTSRKAYEYILALVKSEKNTIEHVLNFSLNNRMMYQSQKTICERLGYRRRQTVNEKLQKLWRAGILLKVKGGFNKPNSYVVSPALRTPEFIRMAKDIFKCAQAAWFRLLLYTTIDLSLLLTTSSVNNDFIGNRTLKNSNKNLNIKNCNCTTVYYCRSDLRSSVKGKKMNVKKETFENLKVKGFNFNDAARCELQAFDDDIVMTACDQYSFSYGKKEVDNPWLVFMGITKRICKDRAYNPQYSTASAMKAQYGITESPNLEYTKPVSDNYRERTPSNGKTTGSGTRTTHTPDMDGWTYGVMPDGTRVRSRGFQGRTKDDPESSGEQKIATVMSQIASGEWYARFPTKELADKTASAIISSAKAQIAGDFDLKRKMLFENLASVSQNMIKL